MEHFNSEPAKREVVKFLLQSGYSVDKELGIHANGIKFDNKAIAEEVGVDRRTVSETIDSILEEEKISSVFQNLSTIPFLAEAAPDLDLHVIEIHVSEAKQSGMLAELSNVFADHEVMIRQAVVEDPYFNPQPKFVAVIDEFRGDLLKDLKSISYVESVTYT